MVRINKLFNNHILLVSTVIIVTSFVALFFVNTERFYATASSSILAPEFDFNAKLKVLTEAQKTKDPSTVRDELLTSLANEHIPIIMCAFYDLVTGPKRLQKPDNVDEAKWLSQIWSELMVNMGVPPAVYISIQELRYNWFTETRDTFETFQAKLEPAFVKATLERYVKSTGNFVPSSVDKYNQALQCKLYRTFSKSASLLNYNGTYKATTRQPTMTQSTITSQPTMTQSTTTSQPTMTQEPSSEETSQEPSTEQTSQEPSTEQTSQEPSTEQTSQEPSAKASSSEDATKSNATTPVATAVPASTATTATAQTPLFKWVVPSNFTAMCLESGNRFQCFLMSVLFVISIICIIAVIATLVSPMFSQRSQVQSQF